MKKILFFILATPLFISFLFSSKKPENIINTVPQHISPSSENSNPNLSILVDGNNDFSLAMYNLLKKEKKGNMFYSPYSISLIVAMVYAGAKDETAAKIAYAMRYKLNQDNLHPTFNFLSQSLASRTSDENAFSLKIVNDIWSQKDYYFLENYIDTLTNHYDSDLHKLDFISSPEQSRNLINAYIYEQTGNLIKDLIPKEAINPLTRLVLTNAIYLKAEWQKMFDKNATFDGIFNLDDTKKVTVPMMAQKSFFKYTKNSNCEAIELPYKGDNIAMVIILPQDLASFEEELNIDSLKEISNAMTLQNIKLQIPKFKLESTLNLKNVLCSLGMPIAFDPIKADFGGITPIENLYLQEILQKAFVTVDEKGTEAAAATAAILNSTSASQPIFIKQMIIDRPFIFIIHDKNTESILFMGRVLNPEEN